MIETQAELQDLAEQVVYRAPTKDEAIAAARFLICVSAPRRSAKARCEGDARDGLGWLCQAGITSPDFPGVGYRVAERIREWFEATFPVTEVSVTTQTMKNKNISPETLIVSVKMKELRPGDLYSFMGPDYWLSLDISSVGEKVYIRTTNPLPAEGEKEQVWRVDARLVGGR